MRNTCEVQITLHPKKADWYVATYRSGFLGAAYSVEFANTITGAVALYHFVEMLKTRYPEGHIYDQRIPRAESRNRFSE